MPKRFFDSKKYENAWFRNLTPEMKCVYDYCICECDHAGILKLDPEMIVFKTKIKMDLTLDTIAQTFKDKFIFLSENKIFIPRFIYWQYKNELVPNNKVHRSVYNLLKEEGIQLAGYFASGVNEQDFEHWDEISRYLRENGQSFKDFLKERE